MAMTRTHARGSVAGLLVILLSACGGARSSVGTTSVGNVLPNVATAIAQPNTAPVSSISPASTALLLPQGAPTAHPVATPPVSTLPMPVTLHYVLPANVATSSLAARKLTAQSTRTLQANSGYSGFTSTASAISISLNVTPLGGSTTNSTGTCTASGTGTSGTCTVTFTATPGPTTLAGTLTEAGNVVASFAQLQIIQPSTVNTINFTANPVVSSVTVQLAAASVNAGTPSDTLLTVNAKDANGNTIAGTTPYVDTNGNPIAFTLKTTNAQAGGSGTVTIKGPSRITAPGQALTYAHYDGQWLDNTVITAATTGAVSMTGATLTIVPHITEYGSGLTSGASLSGVSIGIDGNIWAPEWSSNNGHIVSKITVGGLITEYSTGISLSSAPNFSATGPDGNTWFTEGAGNRIGRISTSGTVKEFTGITANNPVQIVAGPDGNMWFTEYIGDKVGVITMKGVISDFSVNGANPRGIVLGSDGNLWVTYHSSNFISRITRNRKETDFPYPDAFSGGFPDGLAVDANGNIWFPSVGGYYVCRYTKSTGLVDVISTGITNNAGIRYVAVGPDGNVWFTELNTGYIGRITPSGSVTEYTPANGITANSQPYGIITGSDGNIWFTEFGGNLFGKLIL